MDIAYNDYLFQVHNIQLCILHYIYIWYIKSTPVVELAILKIMRFPLPPTGGVSCLIPRYFVSGTKSSY